MSCKTIDLEGKTLEVEYNYDYDPGVDRYSNGDPGYPACGSFEIISIELEGVDYIPVLKRFEAIHKKSLMDDIEDKVIETMDE